MGTGDARIKVGQTISETLFPCLEIIDVFG